MISVPILLLLVWVHTIADFVFQTDKMAINKSSSNRWLTLHVWVYILPFMVLFGPSFAAVNFLLHWATDYVSSRMTSKLWKAGKRHAFFVVIGIDQALHMTALILTYHWIGGWK
jgi:hypothetical protein